MKQVPVPPPRDYWKCFHCGEVFVDEDGARNHFGPRDPNNALHRREIDRAEAPAVSREAPQGEDVLPWLQRLDRLFSEGCDDTREHMALVVKAAAAEIERLRIEHTRAILRYTAKGYAAGENTTGKHWRQRAEKAEADLSALKAALADVIAEMEKLAEAMRLESAEESKRRYLVDTQRIGYCDGKATVAEHVAATLQRLSGGVTVHIAATQAELVKAITESDPCFSTNIMPPSESLKTKTDDGL